MDAVAPRPQPRPTEVGRLTARPQPRATEVGRLEGSGGLNLVECADPEAEALLAVRLINRHVRQNGGRYRDISVIVRRMEGYGDVVQRAFRRHGIPYFADHRELMGHHPVAELTRSALRLAAHGWAHEGWVSALKSGLVVGNPDFVDRLENAGLAAGLRGDEWMRLAEYDAKAGLSGGAVRELEGPVAAFARFRLAMGGPVSGAGLAEALRGLWTDLGVVEQLEGWQAGAGDLPPVYRAIHHTAWEQMVAWCDAVELAFGDTALPVSEWCAIAEAGLSRLTLGIIPPALDQVLLGAVDRMRQPEVKLTIVLGLNEGVFPAAPASPALLNHAERQALAVEGLSLGWTRLELAAREHYYAYIACTRPSQRLCLTWSRRGLDGKVQIRSSVAERLLALVGLKPDDDAEAGDVTAFDGRLKAFSGESRAAEVVTLTELFECPDWDRSLPRGVSLPGAVAEAAAATSRIRAELEPAGGEAARRLAAEAGASLHPGGVVVSSVSALEDFAECPFRHFAKYGLRLEERDEFAADAAGAGTLLHAILKAFHDRTMAGRGAWRRWLPREASEFLGVLGEEELKKPEFAPLIQDPLVAWETRRRIRGLAAMIEQAIAWMETYAFDPVGAELRFGGGMDDALPAWTLSLENGGELRLRGSIDRVDACRLPQEGILITVLDYKSTVPKVEARTLEHGLDLQLVAYLAYAAESVELRRVVSPGSGAPAELLPAGAFYVPLAPRVKSQNRAAAEEKVRQSYLDSLTYAGLGDERWTVQFGVATADSGQPSRQFKAGQLMAETEFRGQMTNTVSWLKRHAAAILEGKVGVEPIRYAPQETACKYCPFLPLCRFEPLAGGFRTLPPATAKASKTPRVAKRPKAAKPTAADGTE